MQFSVTKSLLVLAFARKSVSLKMKRRRMFFRLSNGKNVVLFLYPLDLLQFYVMALIFLLVKLLKEPSISELVVPSRSTSS